MGTKLQGHKRANHNPTLLWEGARSGKLEAVKYLVSRGAEVNATGCYNNETLVRVTPYCAAVFYKRDAVAAYLPSKGSTLDIFRAAFLGLEDRVAKLLASHPDLINAEDTCDQVVTLLIDHGARIGLEDNRGRTALSLAIAAGKHVVVAALTFGVADCGKRAGE
ncbi:MAG: ankyrin repeat domain-containing protein [Isosphaerales bacterium]